VADRRAEYRRRHDAALCTGCPRPLVGDAERRRALCFVCRRRQLARKLTPAVRARRVDADRRHRAGPRRARVATYSATARTRRLERDVCLECARPPAPDRERCDRHLAAAARRARARRKAARTTQQRTAP
jgi:hypothetical protein